MGNQLENRVKVELFPKPKVKKMLCKPEDEE